MVDAAGNVLADLTFERDAAQMQRNGFGEIFGNEAAGRIIASAQ